MNDTSLNSQQFQEQINEVETLISDLSQGDLNLDTIVETVEKGYQTIESLKQRLDTTKMKIDSLRETFEDKDDH